MSERKKVYILAKDVNTERNFQIKAKKRPEKGLFLVHPNSWSWSQIDFFKESVHLITKYLLPEKVRLLTSLQAEIRGGGLKAHFLK